TLGQIVAALGSTVSASAPAPAPARASASKVSVPKAAPATDLTATLLAVVAEKTGYPTEMLTMEMDLEADLGVDSIKRVEILSADRLKRVEPRAALRERVPGLPEVDAPSRPALQTLGKIGGAPGGAGDPPPPVPIPALSGSKPALDLIGVLLGVVAEKTGYPT